MSEQESYDIAFHVLNYYKKGQKTEAVVTYLREGKAMDALRKAIRVKGYDFVDRKAVKKFTGTEQMGSFFMDSHRLR